jgi:hypothetical protein
LMACATNHIRSMDVNDGNDADDAIATDRPLSARP